jgi:hypothetical protein
MIFHFIFELATAFPRDTQFGRAYAVIVFLSPFVALEIKPGEQPHTGA